MHIFHIGCVNEADGVTIHYAGFYLVLSTNGKCGVIAKIDFILPKREYFKANKLLPIVSQVVYSSCINKLMVIFCSWLR